jgi:hypothetical protein
MQDLVKAGSSADLLEARAKATCSRVGEIFSTAAAVILAVSFFGLNRALMRAAFWATKMLDHARLGHAVRLRPFTALAAGYAILAVVSCGWNHTSNGYAGFALVGAAWVSLGILAPAIRAIIGVSAALPAKLVTWFAGRAKNPRDVHYFKLMLINSLVLWPALLGVIVPALFCAFTFAAYLVVIFLMGPPQESLIHSDVHNHIFRSKHLAKKADVLVFRLMNIYLKCVVPFLSGRFPLHYTAEHGMIHHAEDNGIDDPQTTLWCDRKSFIDYSRFAWRQALQLAFSREWYRYFAQRNMRKPIWLLVNGQLLRYGSLAVIAVFNPWGAICLFAVPFISAVPRTTSIFLWHGLVDMTNPDDVYTNSINIAAGSGGIHAWHVEHHVKPNDHWSHMWREAERDRPNYSRHGTIVFRAHPRLRQLYLKAMWTRRFDLLATMCIPTCEAQRDPVALARLLEERTQPLTPTAHGPRYIRFDAWLGRMVATYLLRGRFPTPDGRDADKSHRGGARANQAAIQYVEG